MRKLIVHETDIHGSGCVQFNGKGFAYWSDGDCGNARAVIEELIKIGFINEEDVIFLDGDEIYAFLDDALTDLDRMLNL